MHITHCNNNHCIICGLQSTYSLSLGLYNIYLCEECKQTLSYKLAISDPNVIHED